MMLIARKFVLRLLTRVFTGFASVFSGAGLAAAEMQTVEAAALILAGLAADYVVREFIED